MRHLAVVLDDRQQSHRHRTYCRSSLWRCGQYTVDSPTTLHTDLVKLVGCVIASLSAYLNGAAGAIHHLGYGALARAAFGFWGSYFVVMLNVFQSFIFYGTQMYFGGMAFVIILNSLSRSFLHMENTLPLSAGITTPQLVGFILFICLYFPIIYFVPPHQVQKLLETNLILSTATLLGIMGWAVSANNGPGNLVEPAVKVPKSQVSFLMIQGITSVAGTYTGGSDRVSDWTRYARSRHAPTGAQLLALPITVTLTALVGVIATSAASELLGEVQWNPMIMVSIQSSQSDPDAMLTLLGSFNKSKRPGTRLRAAPVLSSPGWACSPSRRPSTTPRTA